MPEVRHNYGALSIGRMLHARKQKPTLGRRNKKTARRMQEKHTFAAAAMRIVEDLGKTNEDIAGRKFVAAAGVAERAESQREVRQRRVMRYGEKRRASQECY